MNKKKLIAIIGVAAAGAIGFFGGKAIFDQGEMVSLYGVPTSTQDQEKEVFNNRFEQYCGNNVRGVNVNELLKRVISNNATEIANKGYEKLIKIIAIGTDIRLSGYETFEINNQSEIDNQAVCIPTKIENKAESGKLYAVSIEKYDGYIKEIKIEYKN